MTNAVARSRAIFVLGAKDPEMRQVEAVLAFAGLPAVPARRKRKRVYPGNAYAADAPAPEVLACDTVYAVECGWVDETANVVHVDHHRPGDPGHGKPAAEYFAAASIGQVLRVVDCILVRAGRGAAAQALHARFDHLAHLVAAADHCLGAAFRGECPGVDPVELQCWMLAERAAFEHREVAALQADIDRSRAVIRSLAHDGLADLRDLPAGTVPEAPQAACREGIAVLSRVVDRDGRTKVGLLGATPEQVRRFLAGDLVPGLVQCYGDAARGFAGGYLPGASPLD